MENRKFSLLLKSTGMLVVALALVCAFQYMGRASVDTKVLARVDLQGQDLTLLSLPIYAHLQDGSGEDYALVIAPEQDLEDSGYPYEVIDEYQDGNVYYLARSKKANAYTRIPSGILKLYWDGKYTLILNPTAGQIDVLAGMGFELKRLSQEPIVLQAPPVDLLLSIPDDDEGAARMPAEVWEPDPKGGQGVMDYASYLSGVSQIKFNDGSTYKILTRNTNSGTPIKKATQYVYEYFGKMSGFTVKYQPWSAGGSSGRNVIAERTGATKPKEIVLVVAHLDDMPSGATAPGADDNASGSAAVMYISRFFSVSANRTVRFVLFTGEEQGLLGSAACAKALAAEIAADPQKKVVAVFNMDMIAYDKLNGPVITLHTRQTNNPGYAADKAIADIFIAKVQEFGLNLTPRIQADGDQNSDHSSFWDKGYPAILAIEDFDNDATPFYHKVGDKMGTLNRTYFQLVDYAAKETVKKLVNP